MFYSVFNITRQKPLASRVRVASSIKDRTIGLLGTGSLAPEEGLWLSPCRAIHMIGMRYAIDALWIDREGTVLHAATLRPWRLSRVVFRANGVLELAAGRIRESGTQVGDQLRLAEKN